MRFTKKMLEDVLHDIEIYGFCFIGTYENQGIVVYKRFEKVRKEYEKTHSGTLAYNSKSGIAWEV